MFCLSSFADAYVCCLVDCEFICSLSCTAHSAHSHTGKCTIQTQLLFYIFMMKICCVIRKLLFLILVSSEKYIFVYHWEGKTEKKKLVFTFYSLNLCKSTHVCLCGYDWYMKEKEKSTIEGGGMWERRIHGSPLLTS